jgi:hypothetical protein
MAVMAVIGLIPAAFIFVIVFMRMEGPEPWKLTVIYAACLTLSIFVVFDYFMSLPWPPTLIGGWFPALKFIPSVH